MARTSLSTQTKARKGVVEARPTQVDIVEKLKHGQLRRRKEATAVNVISISFTITPEVDAIVSEFALNDNVSRSHVIRQAVLHYAGARRDKATG